MLERLHFVLRGCVGEGSQDSDCTGESLEEEGALAVVVCADEYVPLLQILNGPNIMRLPRSFRKSMPPLLIVTIVSDATGENKYY